MAIFSIWQALEAIPGPNANCEWFGHEEEGLSCRMPYQWQENHDYKLRVWVLHTDQSSNEWWGAWVVDNVTGQESYVGKILVPSSWQWLDWSVAWVEYYGPVNSCQDIPYANAIFSNLSANNNDEISDYNSSKPIDFDLTYGQDNCADQEGESSVVSLEPIQVSFITGGKKLSIDKVGIGSGVVISNPTGIDCGNDCFQYYAPNTTVILIPDPAADSNFAGWSGACSGMTSTCQVVMNEARSVTATFDSTFTATHTAPANYPVGGLLTISNEFAVPAGTALLHLVWRPTLPTGWTLQSASGDGAPKIQGNTLLFTDPLTADPLRFTYQIVVPANATGTQTLAAEAEYQTLEMINPTTMPVTPSALELRSSNSPHRVDYRNPPWQIDATEAGRILAYWRAGRYHIEPTGLDGYAPGPGNTRGVRHAADFQEAWWVIDGAEASRILSYWRAGGYHADPTGLDGYAPGLAASSLMMRRAAQSSFPQAIQQLQSAAQAGETLDLQVTLNHGGDLLSLLARPELPTGWTITAVTGDGNPQLMNNDILFTAQILPNPLTFQYQVRLPATAQGLYDLHTALEYQSTDMINPATLYAAEDPLSVTVTASDDDTAAITLIAHYYTSILGRTPDADGLAYWLGLIAERQTQGEDAKPVFRNMANFFFNSVEYLGNNTSDTQFITDLYRTFFQREPDQGGMDFWRGQLTVGTLRDKVMAGFLYSPEFTAFMEGLGF